MQEYQDLFQETPLPPLPSPPTSCPRGSRGPCGPRASATCTTSGSLNSRFELTPPLPARMGGNLTLTFYTTKWYTAKSPPGFR